MLNHTLIIIGQTGSSNKGAKFTVTRERNGVILFEENFVYDGEFHPLRLHLEKEKFMKE